MTKRYGGSRAAFTLLLLLIGFPGATAWAQHYAAPGGTGAAPCSDPDTPCSLALAVETATSIPGNTVFIHLADAANPTASFTENEAEDLTGEAALDAEITFDTYLDAAQQGGIPNAVVTLEGDVHLAAEAHLIFAGGLTLQLTGNKTLTLARESTIRGPGTLRFGGAGVTVLLDTGNNATPQAVDLSTIDVVIDMQGEAGRVTFDAVGAGRGAASLTLGDLLIADADTVVITEGLLELAVEDFVQMAGGFLLTSPTAAPDSLAQQMRVGDSLFVETGSFRASGAAISVGGDFALGSPSSIAWFDGEYTAFTLDVAGRFTVFQDVISAGPLDRTRFYLAGGTLTVAGDYDFQGRGDTPEQGLDGTVVFVGDQQQAVSHRQNEAAYFNDVVLDGVGGIVLKSDIWQNDTGTLTLEHGIIDSSEEPWTWTVLNAGFESDLAGRNTSAPGEGVVELGSPDSYLNGQVARRVEQGITSGPFFLGGYLFPVGTEKDGVHFFRPLILQFPDNLGPPHLARVDYRPDLTPENCEWPENGLVVDDIDGDPLILDVLSDQFWQVEFDQNPPFDPNIRVEADKLPNVFDIKRLRLIQWDCGCTNPRPAGSYLVDPGDDVSILVGNGFVDSVPNIIQEGVDVEVCQIIGIASNFLRNQINLPETDGPLAKLQLIDNAPDAGLVDVYLDGNRIWNDADFQTATPYVPVIGGTHTVDIVAGRDTSNSNPLLTQELTFLSGVNSVLIVHGLLNPGDDEPTLTLAVLDDVRRDATDSNRVDFPIVHGWPQLGEVDVLELDPINNSNVIGLLANNFAFGDVVTDLSFDASVGHNIAITNADNTVQYGVFRFELQADAGKTMVFNGSGLGTSPGEGMTLIGIRPDGHTSFPITSGDELDPGTELPQTFTLHSNYPNPFNPTTAIRFDLPEAAWITVDVVDVLGRTVLTTPAQQREAGSAQMMVLDASGLASGTYVYRVTAQTAQTTQLRTGRMTVIK